MLNPKVVKKRVRFCVSVLLASWVWACTGTDTGNPIVDNGMGTETTFAGILRDSLGTPQAHAQVTVRALNRPAVLAKAQVSYDTLAREATLSTDSAGFFAISGLPKGQYALIARTGATVQGLLHHFEVDKTDTLKLPDSLRVTALKRFAWLVPENLRGKQVYVAELGLTFTLDSDSLVIDSLPQGRYTLMDSLGQVLETPENGVSIEPRQENVSSSSSVGIASSSSSSQMSSSSAVSSQSGANLFTDPRDGQVYRTVDLGLNTWMAENLRYAGVDSTECGLAEGAEGVLSGCSNYGRFYTFYQAQEACPEGWRLASYEDWNLLVVLTGGETTAGQSLKSSTMWATGAGLDSFGMTVLPTGSAESNSLGTDAYFWTSTQYSSDGVYQGLGVHMWAESAQVEMTGFPFAQKFPVRCLMTRVETDN